MKMIFSDLWAFALSTLEGAPNAQTLFQLNCEGGNGHVLALSPSHASRANSFAPLPLCIPLPCRRLLCLGLNNVRVRFLLHLALLRPALG